MSDSDEVLVSSISSLLSGEEPIERQPGATAAVAVIVKQNRSEAEFLLIKRAERFGDPWSGQIALPGGKVAQGDASFRHTAERETTEEVGLDLRKAKFLGYTQALQAHTKALWVVPSIFLLGEEQTPRPNQEVSSYRWVRFLDLFDPRKRVRYTESNAERKVFPAYDFDGYLVWGLTERILTTLREAVEHRQGIPSG